MLGVVLVLPIPFGNVVPAFALIAIAVGLMARDGMAELAGLVLFVTALAWTVFLVVAGASVLAWLRASAGL